uniref:Uncharacterized protein n=1 Tax=Glossina palpalis gambiensis TaxID=67801 RepID=A0A1B0C1Y5_9MUSC
MGGNVLNDKMRVRGFLSVMMSGNQDSSDYTEFELPAKRLSSLKINTVFYLYQHPNPTNTVRQNIPKEHFHYFSLSLGSQKHFGNVSTPICRAEAE